MYTQVYTAVLLVWGPLRLTLIMFVYAMLFASIYDMTNANIM